MWDVNSDNMSVFSPLKIGLYDDSEKKGQNCLYYAIARGEKNLNCEMKKLQLPFFI